MINWIFSVLLYMATIAVGFILGSKGNSVSKQSRYIYILWLYVFLCFGYMTGSDWFLYEMVYSDFDTYSSRYEREPGSWFLFKTMPHLISDFWIFTAFLKCIYLYSFVFLTSKITDSFFSVIALSIPCVLAFMLIQNPFRFMIAQIFINFAIFFIYANITKTYPMKNQIVKAVLLLIMACFFHNTSVIYFVLLPLFFISPYIYKANSIVLFVLYVGVTFLVSNLSFITEMLEQVVFVASQFTDMKDYASSYSPEDDSAFFTIGNLFNFIMFLLFLVSRSSVIKKYSNGKVVYGIAIIYCFLSRILILIPTGFRLALPFAVFYALCIIYMIRCNSKKLIGLFMITYILLAFTKKLWTVYDMIPYSNSIPYIVTGHLPYDERCNYNINEYYMRTGETLE